MPRPLEQIKKDFAAAFRRTPGYIGVKQNIDGIKVYVFKEEDKKSFPNQFEEVAITFVVQETLLRH